MSMVASGFWKIQSLIGSGRTVGRHQLLERERQATAARRGVPHHDRQQARILGRGEQLVELGDRGRRLRHSDLLGQLTVVEDAGQAVVEPHRVQRPRPTSAVLRNPVLGQLGGRPLIPAERRGIVVEVHQQAVVDERHHRRQPDQIGRIVTRQQTWRGVHQVGELILADVPRHVGKLPSELLGQRERQIEARLEVGPQLHRLGPTVRRFRV